MAVSGSPEYGIQFFQKGFAARHGMSGAEYQDEWQKWTGKGYLTQAVTGYEENGVTNFAALWR